MPFDDDRRDWYGAGWERPTETITHRHPSLPFVDIYQTRYVDADGPDDDRFEDWSFYIWGPDGTCSYDGSAYHRGDATEAEMIASMVDRAERTLLDERGPFFVLRLYLESGEFRREIDAVMRKHGQWPQWRRAEAAVARRLGVQRSAIRMRYRLRGERPDF